MRIAKGARRILRHLADIVIVDSTAESLKLSNMADNPATTFKQVDDHLRALAKTESLHLLTRMHVKNVMHELGVDLNAS